MKRDPVNAVDLSEVSQLAIQICNLPRHISLSDFVACYEVAFRLLVKYNRKLNSAELLDPSAEADNSEIGSELVELMRDDSAHPKKTR